MTQQHSLRRLLHRLHEHGYRVLAPLLLGSIVFFTFESRQGWQQKVDLGLGTMLMLVAMVSVASTVHRLRIVALFGLPSLVLDVGVLLGVFPPSQGIIEGLREIVFWMVMFFMADDVLRRGEDVSDRLAAAVCFYLLSGVAFARFYVLIDQNTVEQAFRMAERLPLAYSLNAENMIVPVYGDNAPPANPEPIKLNVAVYFSFVTQTTLGYGDITPVHPLARSVAMLQATIGVLYIAIVVAASVGGGIGLAKRKRAAE